VDWIHPTHCRASSPACREYDGEPDRLLASPCVYLVIIAFSLKDFVKLRQTSSQKPNSPWYRPHTVRQTQQWSQWCRCEVLQHPAHSSHLAPSDFHIFGPFKLHLSGQRFVNSDVFCGGDDLVTTDWPGFLSERLQYTGFPLRQAALNSGGDYIQKQCYAVCMCASSCVSVIINTAPQCPCVG
jgi:hypothetical protein